jgi:hypothetical protein
MSRKWSRTEKLTAGGLLLAAAAVAITVTVPEIRRALHLEKAPASVAVLTPEPLKPAVPPQEPKPEPKPVALQPTKSKVVGEKNTTGNNVAGAGNPVGNGNQTTTSTSGPAIGSITQGPGSITQIGGAGNQTMIVGIPPVNHLYDLTVDRKTQFQDSLKRQTEPKAIIRVGCDDNSEESCLAAGRFLLAISEAGWEIDSKRVFRMQQLIPKEGVSITDNDPDGANYKDLPPHLGFWHKMTPTEVTFYYALKGIDIPVNAASDASLPQGMIGIYLGPEPHR